jgi:hypothetical protein
MCLNNDQIYLLFTKGPRGTGITPRNRFDYILGIIKEHIPGVYDELNYYPDFINHKFMWIDDLTDVFKSECFLLCV